MAEADSQKKQPYLRQLKKLRNCTDELPDNNPIAELPEIQEKSPKLNQNRLDSDDEAENIKLRAKRLNKKTDNNI